MSKARTIFATLTTVALLAVFAGSAAATDEPEPAELTGTEWSLASITVDGATTRVPAEVDASLHLEAGQANGSGGCNGFFGSFHVDGPTLSFGPLGATEMFCEGPGQTVEDAYLPALGTVAFWAIADDGTLGLLDDTESEVLAFTADTADTGGIESVTWLLREQASDGAMVVAPDGVLVSLRMDAGAAGGSAGCNNYNTSYVIDGDSISFGPIAATLMGCQGPAEAVEPTYLGNLGLVTSWVSDGATLTFSDAGGNALLDYDAAPEASVVGSWTAVGINNGKGGVVSSQTTTDVTADFSPDGDLTGFDGCNDYFTTYEVDGGAIAISDAIGSTRKGCPSDDLATQSQEYYAALLAATTWSVDDGGNLQLRDDGGSLQVDYLSVEG